MAEREKCKYTTVKNPNLEFIQAHNTHTKYNFIHNTSIIDTFFFVVNFHLHIILHT